MAVFSAASFRAYVETHIDDIFMPAFYGFPSAMALENLPNNKGKAVMPFATMTADPVKKWKVLATSDFSQLGDIDTIEVDSYLAQFRDKYVPTQVETSYLGKMRSAGQDPRDFPFEAMFIELAVKAIAQQNEKIVWQAVTNGGGSSATDLYDGLLEQLKDAITATDVTPLTLGNLYVPTSQSDTIPGGSISIIDAFEQVYAGLPEALKAEATYIYCSIDNQRKYEQAYRNVYRSGVNVDTNLNRPMLDSTAKDAPCYIMGLPGLAGSNRLIATVKRNAIYTYDVLEDPSAFTTEMHLNTLYMFSDYRIGSKWAQANDNWISCNELT